MSFLEDSSDHIDESFGPGTDLVVSMLAALLLILVQILRPSPKEEDVDRRPQQIIEIRDSYDEEPLFEKDNAVLTAFAKEQLVREMPAFLSALRSDCCNQLLIEGHASPEAPSSFSAMQRERWNLSLSVERSMAVIDFLYTEGIPYECMSLAGFGRSHSKVLGSWLGADKGRTMRIWDERSGVLAREIDERSLASERLVRILGIHHERSLCRLER